MVTIQPARSRGLCDTTAVVGDRRQSAEPAVPADRDALLESIERINAYKRDGKAAPYQFLVLMWAISRARSGEARLMPFDDVKDELLEILSPFRVAKTEPDPVDPWYALRNTDWWELSPPLPMTFDDVRRLNTPAGLTQPVYDLLSQDAAFAERALATLTEQIDNAPGQQYVRGHEKVPTGGQVEVSVFGQVKVSTPCSSCRSGTAGPDGDGEGANQSPSPPGSSIEVCEGPHGHHFCLSTARFLPGRRR